MSMQIYKSFSFYLKIDKTSATIKALPVTNTISSSEFLSIISLTASIGLLKRKKFLFIDWIKEKYFFGFKTLGFEHAQK